MVAYSVDESESKDEEFLYEKSYVGVYYNGVEVNNKIEITEVKCPKLDKKLCKSRKCNERRLVVGHRKNSGAINFETLEIFNPGKPSEDEEPVFKGITNLLQYTQKHSCPKEDKTKDGDELYTCHGTLNK